ncbi:MAG: hypothetical protein HGA75_15265 [Thiobacillus sp.]|nr:hypothetical protein [Thiobacillus sp.]
MPNSSYPVRFIVLLAGLVCLSGCAGNAIQRKDGQSSGRSFAINNLAKTDIDMVSELAQREVLAGLRRLTVKLYRRNPQEYKKAGYNNVERAVGRIFDTLPRWRESGMDKVDWAESLRLAFAEHYTGDRVHAYMMALTVMVMASYEHRTQFYMTDDLDAQSLYNSARNLEMAVWKLGHARWPDGAPVLLNNGVEEDERNLSFEREFGKVIAQQDLMALIIEDKSNRAVNRVIQNVASFILLPV